jgi:hypothetical protein
MYRAIANWGFRREGTKRVARAAMDDRPYAT